MKNSAFKLLLILWLVIIFSISYSKAQWFYGIEIAPQEPTAIDSINVISTVGFNLGYGLSCPHVAYYTTSITGSTIELDLFYDVSGPWNSANCYTIDTCNIGMYSPNNYTLNVTINKFGETYIIYDIETETLEFEVTNSSSIIKKKLSEYINIYPNPTESLLFLDISKNLKIKSLVLLNLQGKKLMEFDTNLRELNLSKFFSGLYFLNILTNEGIVMKKVLIK